MAAFALPNICGGTIDTASLRVFTNRLAASGTNEFNLDLWGVGFHGSSRLPAAPNYVGAGPNPPHTKLQEDLLTRALTGVTPTTPVAVVTNTGGNTALRDYLQSFYSANPGYQGGQFVFLRFTQDSAITIDLTTSRYHVGLHGVDGVYDAQLSFTYAPGPGPCAPDLPPTPAGCAAGHRYEDKGDGTILDCNTGLYWLKNAACLSGGLWGPAQTKAAGLESGQCGLTDGSFAGQWVLPTKEQFCSSGVVGVCPLANASNSLIKSDCAPAKLSDRTGTSCWSSGNPFLGVPQGSVYGYWARDEVSSINAWAAFLTSGELRNQNKGATFFTWPVRGSVFEPPVTNTPPVAVCKSSITISASAQCQATVTADQLDNGSSDPNGDPLTFSLSPTGPFGLGNTTVTLTVSDPSNASSSCNATVTVQDTTPPVITLNGLAQSTLECGSVFSDPGALATDNCTSPVLVTSNGIVNSGLPGVYVRTYNASDSAGNAAAPKTRTVTVQDTLAPVITLNGASALTLECAVDSFSDPGASALDACSGAVAVNSSGPVNTATPGSYVRTYSASDGAGNKAAQVTRTVTVQDTRAPALSCPNDATLECPAFTTPAAVGTATASDACGPLEDPSFSDSQAQLCGLSKSLIRTWSASDGTGNTGSCEQVIDVLDTTVPVLNVDTTPIVVTDVDCSGREAASLPVATASDACDGSPTVTNNAPATFVAGTTTTVGFTATDACGNTTTKGVNVTVRHGANINIQADKHTVGSGSHPGSTKTPLVGILVGAYDKSENSCARTVCGGISHQHYQCIVDSCDPVATCVTGSNGACTLNAPPGDYVVISADATKTTLPDPLGVSASDLACGQNMNKYLQQIERQDGKKMPGQTTRRTGSELLIIEPEFVEWTTLVEYYPVVFESVGNWNAQSSVTPPEGFVSDHASLSAQVDNDLKAVQFTITDIGSDWVPTETTHVLRHKGRREVVLNRIGIRLSEGLAKFKGLSRDGHVLDHKGRPIPHAGFDPRTARPAEISGWIEPSRVDPNWVIKLHVEEQSELTLALTRGQGNKVLETLALGVFEPGDYEFQLNPGTLGKGTTFLTLQVGKMVQKVKLSTQ